MRLKACRVFLGLAVAVGLIAAAGLIRKGFSRRVIVPVGGKGQVATGMVELMSRVARLEDFEIIVMQYEEPVTLTTAIKIKKYLLEHDADSILVLSEGFRSRRSFLVYEQVLGPAGIRFAVVPVFGTKTPENWRQSWHGIQDVTLEFAKLWYYRLFVLSWLQGKEPHC